MEARQFIQFEIYNGSRTSFNMQDGGKLIFESGDLQCSCSIVIKHEDDERDTLSCLFRTTDEKGYLWEAESIFTPEIFINRLFNTNLTYELTFFDSASKDWKEAFSNNAIVSGIKDLLDDRFYRRIYVGKQLLIIPFHYQSPLVDIAFLTGNDSEEIAFIPRLLVKVSRINGYYSEELKDIKELPPLVFDMLPEELIFNNIAYEEDPDCWVLNSIPFPLEFKKLGKGNEKQSIVHIVM